MAFAELNEDNHGNKSERDERIRRDLSLGGNCKVRLSWLQGQLLLKQKMQTTARNELVRHSRVITHRSVKRIFRFRF